MGKNTAYNHEKAILENVKNTFRTALSLRKSHEELIKLLRENIYDNPRFGKIRQYQQSYIRGYIHALHDQYWLNVEWKFVFDGKAYKWEELTRAQKNAVTKDNSIGHHVYKEDNTKLYT